MTREIKDVPLTREESLPSAFVSACRKVTALRPRTVIDHILKHGVITTDDLAGKYGYKHAPRAAQDVKDAGIPLLSYRVKSKNSRNITAYTFDPKGRIRVNRVAGRRGFQKGFRDALLQAQGSVDALTGHPVDPLALQIDHRVPYQVSGDDGARRIEDFMLLDPSSQRRKSWACEHCENWIALKDPSVCRACYWAFPEDFNHVAMVEERRIEIAWAKDEVDSYERLKASAQRAGLSLRDFIKRRLAK